MESIDSDQEVMPGTPSLISHNVYYVKASIGGLGMVGSADPLVAGMAIEGPEVPPNKEPHRMQRPVNPDAPRIIEIQTPVPSKWSGWRFTASGHYFVSPDGEHMTAHRLAGLLWRDSMELRRSGLRSRREAEKRVRRGPVKVVIVDLADWHARNVGSRAG